MGLNDLKEVKKHLENAEEELESAQRVSAMPRDPNGSVKRWTTSESCARSSIPANCRSHR